MQVTFISHPSGYVIVVRRMTWSGRFLSVLSTVTTHASLTLAVMDKHEDVVDTDLRKYSSILPDKRKPTCSTKAQDEVQCSASVSEEALLRKVDLHVIPILSIIYLAAFLDRSVMMNTASAISRVLRIRLRVNMSNALTLNLPKDLHLKGDQANLVLTIFFVPYIIFEVPSNILMKRLKPHVWSTSLGCQILNSA